MPRPLGSKNKTQKERLAEISRKNGRKTPKIKRTPNPKLPKKYLPKEDPTYDYLADIYSTHAKIAPEIKLQALHAYLMTGTLIGAEKLSGISHQTLSEWKNKSEWWPIVLAKLKKEKQEELDAKFTQLIDKALDQVEDRILNGDEAISRDGEKIRKRMSGRDLTTSLAIIYDKRAMVRGDPTSISGKADIKGQLDDLRTEFARMAREELNKTVIKDIN